MKKSHYKDGFYFDTTTQTFYTPKDRCELCDARYGLQVHHKLAQSKSLKDLKSKRTKTASTWTQEFINENQELFTLCSDCHCNVHSFNEERFKTTYGRKLADYIYKHRSV